MKKIRPAKLNLYEMWDLYKLNQDTDLARIVPKSLAILYPGRSFAKINIDEKIVEYFRGLDSNLFFYFSKFISGLNPNGN